MQFRQAVSCGVILLALTVYPGSGAALPFDRLSERTTISAFLLRTSNNTPGARRIGVRNLIFTRSRAGPTYAGQPMFSRADFSGHRARLPRFSRAARFFSHFPVIELIEPTAPLRQPTAPLPEPAAGALLAGGLLMIAGLNRRRRAS